MVGHRLAMGLSATFNGSRSFFGGIQLSASVMLAILCACSEVQWQHTQRALLKKRLQVIEAGMHTTCT